MLLLSIAYISIHHNNFSIYVLRMQTCYKIFKTPFIKILIQFDIVFHKKGIVTSPEIFQQTLPTTPNNS